MSNSTAASGKIPYSNNTFYIGQETGYYFEGTMDDVKIYMPPLSATEIEEHYKE